MFCYTVLVCFEEARIHCYTILVCWISTNLSLYNFSTLLGNVKFSSYNTCRLGGSTNLSLLNFSLCWDSTIHSFECITTVVQNVTNSLQYLICRRGILIPQQSTFLKVFQYLNSQRLHDTLITSSLACIPTAKQAAWHALQLF